MKKVLMIAFHYPPLRGSSGIQRTLKFSRYLPDYGWQPIILTASSKAYPQVSDDQLREVRAGTPLKRSFALDTARHLSIHGFYPSWMALPDRWITWWLSAVPIGLRLLRKHRPKVIWSTFPIATAHLIGLTLQRLSGIPWVADFRDSMTEEGYPDDPLAWRAYRWIERQTVRYCTKAVFTAPGALRMYSQRYSELPKSRWALIANGYDEEDFSIAEQAGVPRPSFEGRTILVHSGLLYPWERDPRAFFAALADLRRNGKISAPNLKIILRASGNEDFYRKQLRLNGIEDIVFLEAPLPYQEALAEMLNADGLLIFQASNCNSQIPAKLYEYLRARRPIFALTDPRGDTACVLRAQGIDTMVPLDSEEQIAQGLLNFLRRVREGRAPIASYEQVRNHSRKSRTQDLARLFDSFVSV